MPGTAHRMCSCPSAGLGSTAQGWVTTWPLSLQAHEKPSVYRSLHPWGEALLDEVHMDPCSDVHTFPNRFY